VVKLPGMPFDPIYEIDDDTIAIGDLCEYPAAAQVSSRTARPGCGLPAQRLLLGPGGEQVPLPEDVYRVVVEVMKARRRTRPNVHLKLPRISFSG
jgi:hypothetical protein